MNRCNAYILRLATSILMLVSPIHLCAYDLQVGHFHYMITTDSSAIHTLCLVSADYYSLTSATIPQHVVDADITYTVTQFGKLAFSSCESLVSVSLPSSLLYIGDAAFMGCSALHELHLPDSITGIGEEAFGACYSLRMISIGEQVTEIGGSAFIDCRALTTIHYRGTMQQWQQIYLGPGCFDATPVKLIHCTDGDISVQR